MCVWFPALRCFLFVAVERRQAAAAAQAATTRVEADKTITQIRSVVLFSRNGSSTKNLLYAMVCNNNIKIVVQMQTFAVRKWEAAKKTLFKGLEPGRRWRCRRRGEEETCVYMSAAIMWIDTVLFRQFFAVGSISPGLVQFVCVSREITEPYLDVTKTNRATLIVPIKVKWKMLAMRSDVSLPTFPFCFTWILSESN